MEALWTLVLAGGWFAMEMTLGLWVLFALLIGVPLIIAGTLVYKGRGIFATLTIIGTLFLLNFAGIPVWETIKANPWVDALILVGWISVGFAYARYFEWPRWLRKNAPRINIFNRDYLENLIADLKRSKEAPDGEQRRYNSKDTLVQRLMADENVTHDRAELMSTPEQIDLWISFIENNRTKGNLSLSKEFTDDYKRRLAEYFGRPLERGRELEKTVGLVAVSSNKERIYSWTMFWPIYVTVRIFSDLLREIWNSVFEKVKGFFARAYEQEVRPMNFETTPTNGGSPESGDSPESRGDNVVAISQKK